MGNTRSSRTEKLHAAQVAPTTRDSLRRCNLSAAFPSFSAWSSFCNASAEGECDKKDMENQGKEPCSSLVMSLLRSIALQSLIASL